MCWLGWMLHQKWLKVEKAEGESGIWSTRETKVIAREESSSSSPGFLSVSTFHILDCNLISVVASHQVYHILVVRNKSLSLGKGFIQA